MVKMARFAVLAILVTLAVSAAAAKSGLKTSITYKPETCEIKAGKGDSVSVHYRGKLASTGAVFDESYRRGSPLDFTLGVGQVIKGWDLGVLGMCVGEKRTLTIPPELAYGNRGAGDLIPPGSTLVFDTELVAVNGKTGSKSEL